MILKSSSLNAMKKVVILGAGITGLSVAQTLSLNGFKVSVIEKADRVGGIIKGFKVGKYTFDHGPHAILTRNKAAFDQFKSLIKSDLISIGERRAGIYYKGKHYEYPLKPTVVFRHSSPAIIAKTLFSFLYYNVKRVISKPREKSFDEYIKNYFGKELYEQFFRNYTKKVWEVEPSTLAASFAAERIPKIAFSKFLIDMLKKLKPQKTDEFSENVMYYPKNGVGQIPELLEKEIIKNNGTIFLNSKVVRLKLDKGKIKSVEISENGKRKTIYGDYFVSTIPITLLVKSINPPLGKTAMAASDKLKYKKIKFMFLVVNKKKVFDEHWVYFHDDDNVFYRIFDTSAFSSSLMPKGKTGLIIELSTRKYKNNEKLFEETIKGLESYKLVRREEIEAHYFDELEYGYPIYSLDYRQSLKIIFDEIGKIRNLITVGRQGLFRYLDMDHCIRFGPEVLSVIKNDGSKTMEQIFAQHGKKTF